MSRLSQYREEDKTMSEYDDGFSSLGISTEPKQEKIVVADMDSIIYWVLYEKNEDGTRKELTEEDLPFLEGKLNELILKVLNSIEKYFIIKQLFIFIAGSGNYRKSIYPLYKSNRPPKHFLVDKLYSYMKETFNCKNADGFEAEDYCASIARKLGSECILAYVDHDLLEVDSAILYNFQSNFFQILTPEIALHNKYKKLIVGEAGDFANFTPKIGISYFNKNFFVGMSLEEYEQKTKECFLKCWKTEEKAEEMIKLGKEIIWLKDVNI